jgi:hypothetical protein
VADAHHPASVVMDAVGVESMQALLVLKVGGGDRT